MLKHNFYSLNNPKHNNHNISQNELLKLKIKALKTNKILQQQKALQQQINSLQLNETTNTIKKSDNSNNFVEKSNVKEIGNIVRTGKIIVIN